MNSKSIIHLVLFIPFFLLQISGCVSSTVYLKKTVVSNESNGEVFTTKTSEAIKPALEVSSFKDATQETLAQVLFGQYLLAYKDQPLDPQARLLSYQIEKVEIPEKWQPCADIRKVEFIAAITYSVKPEKWPPPRWAENGTLTNDQWITGKRQTIAVFKSGQYYQMEVLGVPICPGF